MIRKCDHPGCTKAGTCRAPKDRTLKEYWMFCTEHAAEYNKNWNYYAGMTDEEIEEDWETSVFGSPLKSVKSQKTSGADYAKFINEFLTGRSQFDKMPQPSKLPTNVTSALRVFDLSVSASWRDVGIKYRALAKKHHPDTATDKKNAAAEFARISAAYDILKKHFGQK
ncbi:MAG: J domain-containing protein [Alphaproteobacteria bacterium]|nr:J domain-containing protein [Alphaproteobacteria bacterium]